MSETHGNSGDHNAHAPPALAEPKTPMWLPALGAVIFLTVGLVWGLLPDANSGTAATVGADAGHP